MSKDREFSGNSGKFGSEQELTEALNKFRSVQDQGEEMRRIQSGEKRGFADEGASVSTDSGKMHSQLSSDSSVLFSPPPTYLQSFSSGSSASTIVTRPLESFSLEKGETAANQTAGRTGSYHHILLKDIRYETRRQLGLHLDLEHANVANWKSVACEFNFTNLEIQNFDMDKHKTQRMLDEAAVTFPTITVGDLCRILEDLDRRDVITEMEPYFVRELTGPRRVFPRSQGGFQPSPGPSSHGSQISSLHSQYPPPFPTASFAAQRSEGFQRSQAVQDESISTTYNSTDTAMTNIPEKQPFSSLSSQLSQPASTPPLNPPQPESLPPVYTSNPVPPQLYDAFILYDVADKNFILEEFLPKVENEAGIRLFMPGRDSPPGAGVYDSQLQMMMDNCPKLVVIQSDEFLRSPLSKWSLNIALALDPAARKRKIIPVIHKKVTEPSILSGIAACDRTRVLEDSWFWNSIIRSLRQSG